MATVADAKRIVNIGIEKVVLGTVADRTPEVVTEIPAALGSSSTVVSVDAKRRLAGGYDTYISRASRKTGLSPEDAAGRGPHDRRLPRRPGCLARRL